MKIIVGITGASGSLYGLNLINKLAKLNIETHVIISPAGEAVMDHEVPGWSLSEVAIRHQADDLFAAVASGSFRTDGMVVAPCSMKTLSSIANGFSQNLLTRAADVCLKEQRPLILMTRETPLSLIHIRNMQLACEAGATIMPASPGFYHKPASIDEIADFMVERVLDQLNIAHKKRFEWKGKDNG